jgi:hypothetical protein
MNRLVKILATVLAALVALIFVFVFLGQILDKMLEKEKLPLSFDFDSSKNSEGLQGNLFTVLDGEEIDSLRVAPEDILRVEILKGDSAMKVYGDKAQNGAIVITTKNHPEAP